MDGSLDLPRLRRLRARRALRCNEASGGHPIPRGAAANRRYVAPQGTIPERGSGRYTLISVTEEHGTTHTVTVTGDVDLEVAERFAGDVRAAIAARPETVLVDLAAMSFIDCIGMRVLIGAHQHAVARGVRLVIIPPPGPVFQTFRMCGLDRVLPFVGAPS